MLMLRVTRPAKFIPIHVQIELTWRCNWRCVHCYQEDHKKENLTLERLRSLFEELATIGTMHIIITGGEPLLREDIFEILKSVRDNRMAISLYTNGYLINSEIADRLSKLIAVAEISLLAGDEKVHDKLSRVKGSFRHGLSSVKELKERGVDVVVKTPILKPAYHTLRDLEMLTMQLGAQWLADPEISRSYAGNTFPIRYQLNFNELQKFYSDFPQFNPQSNYGADLSAYQNFCLAARQYCFVDALGNMYPCLNFKSACDVQEKYGYPAFAKMGNILDSSFRQIWEESMLAKEIRAATRSNFSTCGKCRANAGCNLCIALNYEENGKMFHPAKTVCNFTKAAVWITNPTFIPASELKV